MNTLTLVKLQKEGCLQRGDEVLVGGDHVVVHSIQSSTEMTVSYPSGERVVIKGIQFGEDVNLMQKPTPNKNSFSPGM